MNKRIVSVIFCVLLVVTFALTAVSVSAEQHTSTVLYVTTETTEAKPGDIIDFTVVMGPVSELGTIQMTLTIPEGLSYVEGSGKVTDGTMKQMGFDSFDWTEETLMINGVASAANYESDSDTPLGSFKCKVNEGFEGTASVQLGNLEFADCQTWDMITDRFSVAASVVTVSGTPAETETSVTESAETVATETSVTEAPATEASDATVTATQPASAAVTQAPTSAQKNPSPKTGESSVLFIGVAMIALAMLGAGVTFIGKKKKNG
ncbi:LPXTG cell wall anchor domain-containing protein [uncultured Ruminococcus sp.]|uniref:LPXTG cell wall anchor domain-containing protein n=1 Tax=uncultured Ruminococcus sp. TaxID=165186 RepID=UPI0029308F92|nr:LPXTG cell wall anchor domain-containing protein [uncultured Ruminococcus sp.]